jgi:hypothetical protein
MNGQKTYEVYDLRTNVIMQMLNADYFDVFAPYTGVGMASFYRFFYNDPNDATKSILGTAIPALGDTSVREKTV